MVVRDDVAAPPAGDDRDLEQLGEAQQVGRGPGPQDAAAGEDDRPLGGGEQLEDVADLVVGRAAPARGGSGRPRVPAGTRSSRRSSGNDRSTGPGRPPSGLAERLGQDRRRRRRRRRARRPTSRARRSCATWSISWNASRPRCARSTWPTSANIGVESWRAVWMPIARLARPDGARAEAGRRPAGQLAVGLGHERGAALVARGDDADAGVAEALEQAEEALAGHREGVADAGARGARRRRAGRRSVGAGRLGLRVPSSGASARRRSAGSARRRRRSGGSRLASSATLGSAPRHRSRRIGLVGHRRRGSARPASAGSDGSLGARGSAGGAIVVGHPNGDAGTRRSTGPGRGRSRRSPRSSRPARTGSWHHRPSAVVLELERDGLVELAQPGDDLLQLVLALARDADRVALDLRLDLRELVADQLGDLLGEVVGQAAPQA